MSSYAHAEISSLDRTKLLELLENEGKFESFFHDLKMVKESKSVQSELSEGNIKTAEKNLDLHAKIVEMTKKLEEVNELLDIHHAEYKSYVDKHKNVLSQYDKTNIIYSLNEQNQEVDNDSERLLRQFVEGSLESSKFSDAYMTCRRKFHENQLKIEKYQRFLND